jgi:hypothetical protein
VFVEGACRRAGVIVRITATVFDGSDDGLAVTG